jgi:hypothetical protein
MLHLYGSYLFKYIKINLLINLNSAFMLQNPYKFYSLAFLSNFLFYPHCLVINIFDLFNLFFYNSYLTNFYQIFLFKKYSQGVYCE